jgi:hypothetical protein
VRYFLTRRVPPVTRILLIESGHRELGEKAIDCLRKAFGADIPIDVLGCRRTPPLGVESYVDVAQSRTFSQRLDILRRIRRAGYSVVGVLSSGESTMALWKWPPIVVVPAKFLVINENVDFFWIDRGHWTNAVALLQQRSGLGGESTVRAVAWFAALPFAALFLLCYATWVHVARVFRLLLGIRCTVRSN